MKKNKSLWIRLLLITLIFIAGFSIIIWQPALQKSQRNAGQANTVTLFPTSGTASASPPATDMPENQTAVTAAVTPDVPEVTAAITPDIPEVTAAVTPDVPEVTAAITPVIPEVTAAATPDIPEVTKAEGTANLLFAGDLMCLAGQQFAAKKSDGTYNFSGSFALISDILKTCDLAAANLETLLSGSIPYSSQEKTLPQGSPNCNAPADYLDYVQAAGFTALITANNHCLDGGILGIRETLAQLDLRGISHTGTYASSAASDSVSDDVASRYLMFDCNGIQVALISFTELINLRDSLSTTELNQHIDCYSKTAAAERIAAAQTAGAEFIVVYMHWGSENTHEVRSYQRAHAAELAEAGANLIIGSHPHCLQEKETITTESGREVPCFYSLGNVVSSMTREINNDTVFVSVRLKRIEDSIQIDDLSVLPCHVIASYKGSSHVIMPLDYPVDNANTAAELAEAKKRISSVIPLD